MEDETQDEYEPKISLPEVIFIGIIFALIDATEIAIVFVGLDDFWILDILASSIFFYLFIKGVPPMRQLVTWILELFPWLGALPLLTLGWGLTVWADHHPSGVLAKARRATTLAKGGVRGGAAPATGKLGTRSLERMERAEERIERLRRKRAGGKISEAVTSAEAEEEKPKIPKKEVPKEALGEKPEVMEELPKRLLEEFPEIENREEDEEEELEEAA